MSPPSSEHSAHNRVGGGGAELFPLPLYDVSGRNQGSSRHSRQRACKTVFLGHYSNDCISSLNCMAGVESYRSVTASSARDDVVDVHAGGQANKHASLQVCPPWHVYCGACLVDLGTFFFFASWIEPFWAFPFPLRYWLFPFCFFCLGEGVVCSFLCTICVARRPNTLKCFCAFLRFPFCYKRYMFVFL